MLIDGDDGFPNVFELGQLDDIHQCGEIGRIDKLDPSRLGEAVIADPAGVAEQPLKLLGFSFLNLYSEEFEFLH